MMPVSASIVMAAFPETFRGRAMGVYVGISQIFLALGPLLGGSFTQWASWRAVFWINVPVGIVALVLVHIAAPPNLAQRSLRISANHVALLMAGIGASVYALQQSSTWGWGSVQTLGTLAGGLVVLAGFVLTQLRSPEPLVDVRLFAVRSFLGDTLVLFATQFSMLAMTLYAALYGQNLLGYSPVRAGFSSMALILPLMVAAQIAGRWYDRSGARAPLLTGMAIATLGAVVWALALPHLNYVSKVPGMALAGFGLGLVFSPVNTDALSRVLPAARPQASGIVQTVRQLGGTLGVAVIGAVIIAHEHAEPTLSAARSNAAHAIQIGFWIAAGMFAVGLVTAAVMLPKDRADA
jgi:MFS family permease